MDQSRRNFAVAEGEFMVKKGLRKYLHFNVFRTFGHKNLSFRTTLLHGCTFAQQAALA